MKVNLKRLDESMDKVKIELEAENGDEELILANVIGRHGIRNLVSRSVPASIKMTPPARKEAVQFSPMKLEIVL